jgi:hypothetical protein
MIPAVLKNFLEVDSFVVAIIWWAIIVFILYIALAKVLK